MGQAGRTYVGLDIGTTKISCIIADMNGGAELRVVGVGTATSEGLRRGVVVDLEKTVASIQRAVDEAERMAGMSIKSVYAGIAGDHIRSINSRGVIAVSRKDNEIGPADVERVIEAAKAIAIPMDREIIHVIPQEFIVDDQNGIKDPVGMSGVRLEAEVHIITGAVTSAKNICRSIQRAGLKVYDLVLEPLASSHAVLGSDERDLGVVLLDCGGGTTDVAVFFEGSIRHTAIVPFGGANVTNDIAIGLRTPIDKAEQIKIQHGVALAALVSSEEMLTVSGVGGRADRRISRHVLASMIEPRMEEIFVLANKEVKKNHFAELLGGGVVLTGGTSLMPGVVELAEQVFEMPVRLGAPHGLGGLSANVADPRFSTGVGLVLHGALSESGDTNGRERRGSSDRRSGFDLRRWFSDLF
ncbi:MAG: cell division protein FtsA [Candidatus Eisenbacteria bacterium RBG_16_71_46]|nr:MAG: cell division protein FtsA [Candidatus Eisenbacteria bacterium RBG_16_71_46]OGF22623.1 MAG: cell division protein FtsA [Candidatus Eisenbacteria bacterium RBG_19FT_COMBO_70_11]